MTSRDSQLNQIELLVPPRAPAGRRYIIALGGPPAAGKSTLAAALQARLAPRAGLLGLDAFHYDDRILAPRGHLERKGAPHTFDVAAYARTLSGLRDSPGTTMSIPVFDRELELARNCAALIQAEHDIVITEGNYLLLDREPWRELHGLFDLSVWIDPGADTVSQRLITRWRDHGRSDAVAHAKANTNDLPNAQLVRQESRAADINLV